MSKAHQIFAVLMAAIMAFNVMPASAQQRGQGNWNQHGWDNGPIRCEDYRSPRDLRQCERQRPRPQSSNSDEIGAAIGAGIIGLTLGAIIAGAANENDERQRVQQYQRWVAYCSSRYRSFDVNTGTFLGFDGRRHACQ